MTKSIVFDFDGVVVRDSESFKTAAWRELFPPNTVLGVLYEEAEKTFGRGRGGDRFDILRATFHADGWRGTALDKLVQYHAGLFDDNVQRAIIAAGVRAEDIAVLRNYATRLPLFLNSATPVDALERTVKAIGLTTIFGDRILGRPRTKEENFVLVSDYCQCEPSDILFVGDSASDAKAAFNFGCRFIGFRNVTNNWEDPVTFPLIDSLAEIENHLA